MAILSFNTLNELSAEHLGPAHGTLVFHGTVVGNHCINVSRELGMKTKAEINVYYEINHICWHLLQIPTATRNCERVIKSI